MEEKKFRLRLNLFDAILLLLLLGAGGFMLFRMIKPQSATTAQTVRYTVCLERCLPDTGSLVKPGDALMENAKKSSIGTVVSSEAKPAERFSLNLDAQQYVLKPMEGAEDVYITAEAPCTITDDIITLDGSYILRVGDVAFVRGPGYMGSGPIVSIEREAKA